MSKYIKIAEEVLVQINSNEGFSDDPINNINLLIKTLRKNLKNTSLKSRCNYIDLNEYFHSSEKNLEFDLDFTMMPKNIRSVEFLIWVANFIEKITYEK